jgi:uncharacterized membrane protein YqjE
MKFTIIGLIVLLALTVTSSTERISGWGGMVFMWLLAAIGTAWVLAGERHDEQGRTAGKRAA